MLNYTQSNITSQIQALEASLGTPLFDRLGKTVVLTEAGQRLLPYAEQLLDLSAAAAAEVSGSGLSGTLAIGAAETILSYRLPPVVQQFRAAYPGVELVFKPSACIDLPELLRQGAVHLAFLFDEPGRATQLVAEPLVDEELVLVGRPGHPLAGQEPVAVDRLAEEVVLLTDRGCPYRRQLEESLAAAAVRPAGSLEFASLEAIKRCAAMGVGVALLPRVVVGAELATGTLARIPLSGQPLTVRTFVAWHKDKSPSPALRAFLSLAQETLAG